MTLKLVSAKVVPLTLTLAKRFRDMKALKNERHLKSSRCKGHVKLIEDGKFFTPLWGECRYEGTDYRGNGNHTSNLLTACLQAQTDDGLDEKAAAFVQDYLLTRGGEWDGGSPSDLPVLEEGMPVMVEKFTADNENDLVDFFRRYDPKEAARTSGEILYVYVGKYDDLIGLDGKKLQYALSGVLRAARIFSEEFGFSDNNPISLYQGPRLGGAFASPKVREATRWIVETVPDESLYSKVAGSQVFAELWAKHGPEVGEKIVEEIMRQIDAEEEPAASWEASLNKRRNRPTLEALIKKGRTVVKAVAEEFGEEEAA